MKLYLNDNKIINRYMRLDIKLVKGINIIDNLDINILYVLEGEIKYRIREKEIKASSNEIIIINKHENGIIYSKDLMDSKVLAISLSEDYIKKYNKFYNNIYFKNYIDESKINSTIRFLIKDIYMSYKDNNNIVFEYMEKLLDLILNNYINYSIDISNHSHKLDMVNSIKSYIDENILNEISLNKISKKFYISPQQVSSSFQEILGIKYSKYIQQKKLYYACNNLVNTSKSIQEISMDLNFKSNKSLNRIFNHYLGISPSKYRQIYKVRKEKNTKEIKTNKKKLQKNTNLQLNRYDVNINNNSFLNSKNLMRSINNIYDLTELGESYLEYINREKTDEINRIVLKIEKINNYSYRIKGINNSIISLDQLQDLIYISLKNNIKIILGLYIYSDNLDYILNEVFKFYNYLSDNLGKAYMNKIMYIINIENVLKSRMSQIDFKANISYIKNHKKIIGDLVENKNFMWGIDLGTICDSNYFVEIYEKYFIEYISEPNFIYMNIKYEDKLQIENYTEIKNILEKAILKLKSIYDDMDKLNYQGEIYINGLFRYIDISNISLYFRDNMISNFILNIIFLLDEFSNIESYIIDFSFIDNRCLNNIYTPDRIDSLNFYTSSYWLSNFLKSIHGKLIYRDRYIRVFKDNTDIYILMAKDSLNDYNNIEYKYKIDDLENLKLDLELSISGLEGRFKVSTKTISFRHTNKLNYLQNINNYKYLNYQEKKYLKNLCIPNLEVDIVDIKDIHNENITLYPFDIVMKKYTKI